MYYCCMLGNAKFMFKNQIGATHVSKETAYNIHVTLKLSTCNTEYEGADKTKNKPERGQKQRDLSPEKNAWPRKGRSASVRENTDERRREGKEGERAWVGRDRRLAPRNM